jgi:hypothetical protein
MIGREKKIILNEFIRGQCTPCIKKPVKMKGAFMPKP